MNTVFQTETAAAVNSYAAAQKAGELQSGEKTAAGTKGVVREKTSTVYGNTVGTPKLSEQGMKYYEELKKKFSNMDFVLVSSDMKEAAKSMAGSFSRPNRTVVLIDEEKIERMATDEKFRERYEGIIRSAEAQLSSMGSRLAASAGSSLVKTYGMQVNDDGTASFFAVVDKSLAAQRVRIEKNAAKKKEEKKKAQKEAEEEKQSERLEKRRADSEKAKAAGKDENVFTITASSVEELLRKIEDTLYADMSDHILTEEEKQIGRHFDFRG